MKLVGGGSIALAGVSCLVLVGVLAYSMPRILWPIRLLGLAVLFVLFGASEWVLWMGIKPPALRADAIEVRSTARFDRQRMQRSNLAFIFRGQVSPKGRARGTWYKSYVFAATDGTVGMSSSALVFTPDGMAQFAQRLQVPIRGDFSVRVKDRVEATTA